MKNPKVVVTDNRLKWAEKELKRLAQNPNTYDGILCMCNRARSKWWKVGTSMYSELEPRLVAMNWGYNEA